jgi:sulfatase modifying factor 1
MRLPTEAEWEHAARAGSLAASYGPIDSIGWYIVNSGGKTHDVAQKQPNRWGLYDMLGNVWQWVADWYGETYYSSGPRSIFDPTGPATGESRVRRGGSWSGYTGNMRVSARGTGAPEYRDGDTGFRCAENQARRTSKR